ncbi:hypothetical protein AC578_10765 [Pseudocercospora eumusae]|uniref:AAA+ ATPase domain-containing protein n=1 Tax=Pseudocercospora eumusae TaxID=321146 RepID=A0A139GZZ4_9PEZI|nr:hypothetical protein AC578_10765 [Pseudocercospora eumusae]
MEDYNDFDYDLYQQPVPAMGTGDDLREAPSLDPVEVGEKIKKNEIGLDADIRQLYREDLTKPWQTWKEDAENERANHPKNSKYALVVRRQMSTESDDGLQLHSVTVQSPILRKLLDDVFEGSREVCTTMKDLTFKHPFHEFLHRWDRYLACVGEVNGGLEKQHVQLLHGILEPVVGPLVEQKRDILKQNRVDFKRLWMIFEPDCEITTPEDGRLFTNQDTKYEIIPGGEALLLGSKCVNYNGKFFGYQTVTLGIDSYEGFKMIDELEVVPVALHPRRDALIEEATARGKRFADLSGWQYKSYTGIVTIAEQQKRPRMVTNGRIVVDPDLYGTKNGQEMLEPLYKATTTDKPAPAPSNRYDPHSYNPAYTGRATPTIINKGSEKSHAAELKDHHYRLCTNIVKGYCLTSKQWAKFDVDGVGEINFSKAAFKRLFLPHDYKELILAFVDSHLNRGDDFDDIVEGKGKGMVILLHGAPGLGKTLTAEAVAEEMQVPLYAMSAGQLGFDAETIEYNLQDVLDICAKWGAVLLLDEADVFLEQRQITDIHRNRLVSIFLRMLEYYQGCMFLTTNRVETFDLAFRSRINLAIDYPNLDFQTRRHIWRTFVRPSEDFPNNHSAITEDQLFDLAELDLNGREVKNLVKTGRLLAKRKGEQLGIMHMISVMSVQRGLPGDGSGFKYALPDSFQVAIGSLITQATMRTRRGISMSF